MTTVVAEKCPCCGRKLSRRSDIRKLSDKQAEKVRHYWEHRNSMRLPDGEIVTIAGLARMYDIDRKSVYQIIRGETYK